MIQNKFFISYPELLVHINCMNDYKKVAIFMFFFFPLAYSKLEEFSDETFGNFLFSSFEKPIFMLFYNPTCTHCAGFPEKFARFAESTELKDQIIVMKGNCRDTAACNYFSITATPSSLLIMGNSKQSWIPIDVFEQLSWETAIKEKLSISLQDLEQNKIVIDESTYPIYPTFHLSINTRENSFFKTFELLSRSSSTFNTSFYYHIDEKAITPTISLYRSQNCIKTFQKPEEQMKSFILDNSYGIVQEIDFTDYSDYVNHTVVLFIYKNNIANSTKKLLHRAAIEKCDDTLFVIMNVQNKKELIDNQKISITSVPLLFLSDRRNGCIIKWKTSVYKAFNSLVSNIREGKCYANPEAVIEDDSTQSVHLQMLSVVFIIFYLIFNILSKKFKMKDQKYLV